MPPIEGEARMILRIHHAQVMIPTGAEAQARRFYCDLLGLQEVAKPVPLAVRGGFWLSVGEQQLHIGIEPEWQDHNQRREHVAYEVDDLNAWRTRLATAGVAVRDAEQVSGYRRIELRDPFGNRIEMMQRTE